MKTKYNLTIWQRIGLIPLWILWFFNPSPDRKTWHKVKKGMEKHEHKFTIPYSFKSSKHEYRFLQCEHEGCNFVSAEEYQKFKSERK